MPREIPIPYSPEMVRARRAGIKTNTRRKVRLPNDAREVRYWAPPSGRSQPGYADPGVNWWNDRGNHLDPCPYGQPGDLLWVREAWRTLAIYNDLPPRDLPRDAPIWYEADGPAPVQFAGGRYRHARFMMRWMSRGLDEVVEIRVERLQDISEADAKAEGVVEHWLGQDRRCNVDGGVMVGGSPIYAYRRLWEEINGAGTWAKNPLVWVVSFKVLKP